MDKAGPYPVSLPIYLYFTIPGEIGAILSDLNIEWIRNGVDDPPENLYLHTVSGTDHYYLSNRDGGLPYLSSGSEDLYITIEHVLTGKTRLLHLSFSDHLDRLLALFENYRVENTTFETQLNFQGAQVRVPTDAKIRTYTDSTKAVQLASYTADATYVSGELQSHQVLKD